MKKRTLAMLLAGVMSISLFAGCSSSKPAPSQSAAPSPEAEPFELNLCFASEPQSIDPALNSAVDGAIMIGHMFEGLMKWADSGVEAPGSDGTATNATIVNGQAESVEKVLKEDGTVT